jgi:hypothetical protein
MIGRNRRSRLTRLCRFFYGSGMSTSCAITYRYNKTLYIYTPLLKQTKPSPSKTFLNHRPIKCLCPAFQPLEPPFTHQRRNLPKAATGDYPRFDVTLLFTLGQPHITRSLVTDKFPSPGLFVAPSYTDIALSPATVFVVVVVHHQRHCNTNSTICRRRPSKRIASRRRGCARSSSPYDRLAPPHHVAPRHAHRHKCDLDQHAQHRHEIDSRHEQQSSP